MSAADLEAALADLLARDRERQADAHERLRALAADPAVREELARRMDDLRGHRDPQVRGSALILLATVRGAQARPSLVAAAADPEPGTRCDVAQAATLLEQEGEPILLQLLGDPVLEVRFAAAAGLAELGRSDGLAVLVEALRVGGLRFQALSWLRSLADARAREPVTRLFKRLFLSPFERVAAAGVLARLGDGIARAWLLERIARRKGDERGLAIELAGELRLEGAAEVLGRVLEDPSDPYRGAAARALGLLGEERWEAVLQRLLLDAAQDAALRMDAAEGLAALGSEGARAALERAEREVRDAELQQVIREALAAAQASPPRA